VVNDLETAPIPMALASERAVLAGMLNSAGATDEARLRLPAAAFYNPRHAILYSLMLGIAEAGLVVEPMTVHAELQRRGQVTDEVDVYQLHLTGFLVAGNLAWHIQQIRHTARLRTAREVNVRLAQRLTSGDPDDAFMAIAQASLELELVADPIDDEAVEGLTTWADFHQRYERDDAAHWAVPGLLRRQDIMFVLAAPGVGKSYLSRQVVQCLAAGVHPFTLDPIAPVRTLLIDLENAPSQVAFENRPSFQQIERMSSDVGEVGDRGWIWMHQEGLNLRTPEHARLLEQVIAQTRPDVVAFGSLYNAYKRGNDGWDTAAEDVQDVLKKLRKRYDLTFWIEHHMVRAQGGGHTGAPFGGTSWEKWPTHGRILERARDEHGQLCRASVYQFASSPNFRGDRGERELPVGFRRGGRLPWMPIWDEAELDLLAKAGA
jgi:hypothetical protein